MSLLRVVLGGSRLASVPGRFDAGPNQLEPFQVLSRYSALVMFTPAKSPGELLPLLSPEDSTTTVVLGVVNSVPSSSR